MLGAEPSSKSSSDVQYHVPRICGSVLNHTGSDFLILPNIIPNLCLACLDVWSGLAGISQNLLSTPPAARGVCHMNPTGPGMALSRIPFFLYFLHQETAGMEDSQGSTTAAARSGCGSAGSRAPGTCPGTPPAPTRGAARGKRGKFPVNLRW